MNHNQLDDENSKKRGQIILDNLYYGRQSNEYLGNTCIITDTTILMLNDRGIFLRTLGGQGHDFQVQANELALAIKTMLLKISIKEECSNLSIVPLANERVSQQHTQLSHEKA